MVCIILILDLAIVLVFIAYPTLGRLRKASAQGVPRAANVNSQGFARFFQGGMNNVGINRLPCPRETVDLFGGANWYGFGIRA